MTTKFAAARFALRRVAIGSGLIASVIVIGTSCDDPVGVGNVASVLVTPQASTLTWLYDTLRFTATARNSRGEAIPNRSFTWSVEPTGVVGVGKDGLVTALGPGTARVIATTDSSAGSPIVGSADVSVAQVVVSVVSVTLDVRFRALGDSMQFGLEARDTGSAEVKGTTFTYRSSNDSVVTVSPTGRMKAISNGSAYVVATAFGKSDSVAVVVQQDVATVVMSPDTAMIRENTTRQFTALPKDHNGYPITGRSITWATSDARVVTVNGTGLATSQGKRLGPATLTATIDGVIGQAPVYLFAPFIAVSALGEETCAITAAGRPYCWGLLNYATLQRSEIPLAVTGAPPLTSIGTGPDISCGLASGGTTYCWLRAALPSATLLASVGGFTSLSVGYPNAYGLTSGGTAYTWTDQAPTPTAVPGGLSFTTISAGGNAACGTVASGAAYCWGSNIYGSLGDSTYQDRTAPTPVYGGLTFASLSASGAQTCGITTGGAAYCWGSNGGAFGDGTTTNSPIPVPAAGGLALTSIMASGAHTCGLDASGTAYCWGLDDQGELGDGTFAQQLRLSPVRVSGGLTFTSLSVGGQHTCGLTSNGALYCWGRNYDRELGDGTALKRAVPTLVAGSRP
jgi:hypothetical protein